MDSLELLREELKAITPSFESLTIKQIPEVMDAYIQRKQWSFFR